MTVNMTVNVEEMKVSKSKAKQLADCRRIIASLETKLALAGELVSQLKASMHKQSSTECFKKGCGDDR